MKTAFFSSAVAHDKQLILLTLKENFIDEKMGRCFLLLSASFCSPWTGQLH
jgi:hypothetical protein